MTSKKEKEAQNPLILRCHRLIEAFSKADDERILYLDKLEGFLLFIDLDKSQEELDAFEKELEKNEWRYCLIPKMTFYEAKKIMEGFVAEKVYDIDTKEKLFDIIQAKGARENFLEFIHDHHSELEKWHLYYQERSRIHIIEWLRTNHFHFVFEEDLDLQKSLIDKLKQNLFETKVGKDLQATRKALFIKAKSYYSSEALNPRPKRGRPPKQIVKADIEPQASSDIYTTIPPAARPFLFIPEAGSAGSSFSSKFDPDQYKKRPLVVEESASLQQKLASLRSISSKWVEDAPILKEKAIMAPPKEKEIVPPKTLPKEKAKVTPVPIKNVKKTPPPPKKKSSGKTPLRSIIPGKRK